MERYARCSGDAQPYPSGLSMSDDEDVGGLRLVGAWPGGVRHEGVGQVTCLCLVGKTSGSVLHRKKTCWWSMTSPRRHVDDVDDEC